MATHYLLRRLPPDCGEGSEAAFAAEPSGEAVVFVHGFNGSATGTWRGVTTTVAGRSRCARADLYFFGYNSLYTPSTVSAGLLRQFLRRLWDTPVQLINPLLDPSVRRPLDFRHRRVTLVGHSLGSIVARQAIVDGLRGSAGPDEWSVGAQMLLFAPAHKGARVPQLAMECLTGLPYLGSFLGPLIKMRYPTLGDLESRSLALETLEERVLELHRQGRSSIVARKVFRAELDDVVEQIDFGADPSHELVLGRTHTDICKPCNGYSRPVDEIEASL